MFADGPFRKQHNMISFTLFEVLSSHTPPFDWKDLFLFLLINNERVYKVQVNCMHCSWHCEPNVVANIGKNTNKLFSSSSEYKFA